MEVFLIFSIVFVCVIVFLFLVVALQKKGIYLIPNADNIIEKSKQDNTCIEGYFIEGKRTYTYQKKTITDADDIRNYDPIYIATYSYTVNQNEYKCKLQIPEDKDYQKVLLYYDKNNPKKILLATSEDKKTIIYQKTSKTAIISIVILVIIILIILSCLGLAHPLD